jgi:hypothetical protein
MRPETDDARWRLRLDFWAGRALTADALELEQENRAARLAWRGRLATPGIVTGLEVAIEPPAEAAGTLTPAGHFIHILPGHGLLADGEDVVVPRPLRVALDRIPVHYVRVVGPDSEDPEPVPAGATAGEPRDAGGFVLNVDTFEPGHAPWAAVLVLAPAEFRTFERVIPEDPCELDPSQDAFADERRLDAFVVRLVQLPVRLESLPELANRDNPRWRNVLAHAVLDEQARRSPRQQIRFRQPLPAGRRWDTIVRETGIPAWEFLGVPLALLGSEAVSGATTRSYFLDRAAVVRTGGLALPRTRPSLAIAVGENDTATDRGVGTPFDWRAAVDQFAEHLGSLPTATEPEITAASTRFQFVPPAGFLPRSALTFLTTAEAVLLPARPNEPQDRAGVNHFFPESFGVEAVPVATEDLDAALAASAPLGGYDLAAAGSQSVRVLVPMAQRVFDPRVLVVEREDPVFAATVGRFVATRQDWRQRRDAVARRRDALQTLTDGPKSVAPPLPLDPGQLEPEPVETLPLLEITEALLSPVTTPGPWDVRVTFAEPHTITASTTMFLKLRVDADTLPSRIEVRWRRATDELPFAWIEPPFPLERFDAAGQPAPTPLWLRFPVTSAQLGVTSGAITGFTLHIDDGRVGIAGAGQVLPGQQPDQPTEESWWRAQDTTPAPQFTGGDWTRISGDALLAPFEDGYVPVFPDGRTQDQRVADVESALNPTGATPRSTPMTIGTHGLRQVLATLEIEASEADDFIDANFTRAQINLYRIRKLILGQKAAQKLLINPAIAAIAEQETATASAEQLGSYITAAKSKPVPFADVNAILSAEFTPRALSRDIAAREVLNPESISSARALNTFVNVAPRRDTFVDVAPRRETFIGITPERETLVGAPRRETFIVAEPEPTIRFDRGVLFDDAAVRIASKGDALKDVIGERPETGPTLPPRGLSIGQRFAEPPATQNLSYARSALTLFLSQLPRLRLPLVGETVRSLSGQDVSLIELQGRAIATAPATSESLRTAAIAKLLTTPALTANTDEAEVTLAALDLTEIKSAILRTVERVSQRYGTLVQTGTETLALMRQQRDAAAARVGAIEGKLAEARHDVSVARALRQEEQQRVAEVNVRRDALIRDEVKFLAYVRPRSVDPVRRNLSYWQLDPFDVVATLPACLRRHDEPPPPLATYIQLLRHAPARWFLALGPLLSRLDTPDKMIALLDSVKVSAASFARLDTAAGLRGSPGAVQFTVLGAQQAISAIRQRSTLIPVLDKRIGRWQDFHREAAEHASVGDLVDGKHGSSQVSAAAAAELEQFGKVATCLHAEFAAVTPAVRLAWIERFSQFDRPGLLRDLTILPQYSRLDRGTRRRLQEFADWLFGRVTPAERDAVILVNDLVRLCLLLASHAPVAQIIAGHVPRPTPVRPGLTIPIKPLHPDLVRVGMEFQVWNASRIVARGRVADLREGEVSARVDAVEAQTTTLDTTMRVQFVAQALSFRR